MKTPRLQALLMHEASWGGSQSAPRAPLQEGHIGFAHQDLMGPFGMYASTSKRLRELNAGFMATESLTLQQLVRMCPEQLLDDLISSAS